MGEVRAWWVTEASIVRRATVERTWGG
eukprot:SAG31_NODE_20536_length_571_cov_339.947034_1_plen_26_part_01